MSSTNRAILVSAIASVTNGDKLADVKATVAELGLTLPTTRKGVLEALEAALLNEPADTVKTLEQANDDLESDGQVLSLRDEVEQAIKQELTISGTSSMRIGALLLEVKEDFDKNDEFLGWVADKFGIGKPWAYRLMKVAKTFGTDTRFKGIDTNVLYVLATQADEGQISTAAISAEAGKLTFKSLKNLFGEKPPATPQEPKKAPETDTTKDEIDAVPFDTGAGVTLAPIHGGTPSKAENSVSEAVSQAIKSVPETGQDVLVLKIAELTETINKLMQENQELKQPRLDRKTQQAPDLAHFHHAKLWVRLGLTEEETQDKTAVADAYRSLVKAGYGRGHVCFDLIEEAYKAYN